MLNQNPINTTSINYTVTEGSYLICRVINASSTDSPGILVLRQLLFDITGESFTPTTDIVKYVKLVVACLNKGQTTMVSIATLIQLIAQVSSTSQLSIAQIALIRNLAILATDVSKTSDTVAITLGFVFALTLEVLNTLSTPMISWGGILRSLYPDISNATISRGAYNLIHQIVVSIQNNTDTLTSASAQLLLVTWASLRVLNSLTTGTINHSILRVLYPVIEALTNTSGISRGPTLRQLFTDIRGVSDLPFITPIFLNAIQVLFIGQNTSGTSTAHLVPLVKFIFKALGITTSSSTPVEVSREILSYAQNTTRTTEVTANFIKTLQVLIMNTSTVSNDIVLLLILILASSHLGFIKTEVPRTFEKPVRLYNYIKST